MPGKNKGFTLIELMIVIQIISIIAAIAIPNMIRFNIQTNQTATIGNLATITRAQATFSGTEQGYAPSFDLLHDIPLQHGRLPFVDINFNGGPVRGYNYKLEEAGVPVITSTGVDGFTDFHCRANPASPGSYGSGIYHYFADASGVIRWERDEPADENSTII